jgi:HD-like signal output (HDOD) protein/CheY-like chemotaxis protein
MLRILFVDDEPSVLDAIRRSTHAMRAEWSTEFVTSGPAALAALAHAPVDVVVADMRMPGMDGPQLLAEVKKVCPQAVRFILSGYADPSAIMRVAGTAHQFLAKPCVNSVLKTAISRTRSLRKLLSDERMRGWVGRIDALPCLPGAYQRIVACLKAPDASIADVSRIIGQDMAMTVTILKLVNSAFFGAAQTIRTIDRAVAFLGIDTVTSLVLAHGVFSGATATTLSGADLGRLWQHSLQTATGVRAIARIEHLTPIQAEEAFLAAFLHDVGRLVLATRPGNSGLIQGSGGEQHCGTEADARHAEAGAYLLGLWGFSDTVVEAVAYHHTPSQATGSGFGLPGILHVADALAHRSDPDTPASGPRSLEPGFLESTGAADRWAEWQAAWPRLEPEPVAL